MAEREGWVRSSLMRSAFSMRCRVLRQSLLQVKEQSRVRHRQVPSLTAICLAMSEPD